MGIINKLMSDTSTTTQPTQYQTLFGEIIASVNTEMDCYLDPQQDNFTGARGLWDAMRYATLDGGKRIRSVLAIETCVALGGKPETVLPTACAIEMIHAQSLIHDDLPCMDNDDLRRGKPTVHKAFNESTAVLAGDALIAMAFGLIAKHTPTDSEVSHETVLSVLSDFADVTSVHGLVNGQYVDIQYEGREFDQSVLDYIHSFKTGALFRFSTRAGARLAGAEEKTVEAMTLFGQKIGLAFQIVDDLLDIQSTSETLGKTVGKDQTQQKATYPALFGEAASRQKANNLLQEANALLDTLSLPAYQLERLRVLTQFIGQRVN